VTAPPGSLIVMSREECAALIDERLRHAGVGQSPPLLVDKAELARLVRLCPATIDNLRKEGLPTVKVQGSVRFVPADVLAWLAQNGGGR
jgi:hypothetical protein